VELARSTAWLGCGGRVRQARTRLTSIGCAAMCARWPRALVHGGRGGGGGSSARRGWRLGHTLCLFARPGRLCGASGPQSAEAYWSEIQARDVPSARVVSAPLWAWAVRVGLRQLPWLACVRASWDAWAYWRVGCGARMHMGRRFKPAMCHRLAWSATVPCVRMPVNHMCWGCPGESRCVLVRC